MKILPHAKDSLHHAYFFSVLDRDDSVGLLKIDIEEALGVSLVGNPDFIIHSHDRMTVSHAHELRELLGNRPGGTRICIISAGVVLNEAQNALLKIFEDPPSNTHFFMVSETDSYLLPTLRSRFLIYQIDHEGESLKEIDKFLELSLSEKMNRVVEISEKGTEDTRRFLDMLEKKLSKNPKEYASILEKIIESKKFLLLPSASRKGILESIVCLL